MIIDLSAYDFRLLYVHSEIYALEDHLKLIEDQMSYIHRDESIRVENIIHSKGLSSDDPEWHNLLDEYSERVEFLVPRLFRGSFLVALYAVYETSVTEIANLMQKKQSLGISIMDLKGNFLDRAKQYYRHILKFDLYIEKTAWDHIKMLGELRNTFAHVNGRIDMLNQKSKKTIKGWAQQKHGITTYSGYIVCDRHITYDIFSATRTSLQNLVEGYKEWDDNN
jgi:hypothetical protein